MESIKLIIVLFFQFFYMLEKFHGKLEENNEAESMGHFIVFHLDRKTPPKCVFRPINIFLA